MGIIYGIRCKITGKVYIGQTTLTKKKRLQAHESEFRTGRNHTHSVFQVLEHNNYEIYELEVVEDESKLSEREYYYIQHTDCVNIRDGSYDHKKNMKEYREANKEKILEKAKEYREANREDILEYQKKYREANKEKILEKYNCECGSTLRKSDKARHEKKTEKHLNFLKNNPINKDENEK